MMPESDSPQHPGRSQSSHPTRRPGQPRRPRTHGVLLGVNLLLALLLIVVGVIVIWANVKVGDRLVVSIDGVGATDTPNTDSAESDSNSWNYDTSTLRAKNFLLTGSDNGACPTKGDGTSGGIGDRSTFGERSDTIMVLRVDPVANDVIVLSFPRDLWVKIAGTTRQARINSAFDSKDPSRLIRTIDENFGVPVDHYVNVNLCAFKEIVDSVGGVKIPFANRTKTTKLASARLGRAASSYAVLKRSPMCGHGRDTNTSTKPNRSGSATQPATSDASIVNKISCAAQCNERSTVALQTQPLPTRCSMWH